MGSTIRKLSPREIAAKRVAPASIGAVERIPVFGLLDNIRSRYNVGSIFRTSDGALLQKLYLCGFTPAPPAREIHNTSLGTVETVPWEYRSEPLDAVAHCRSAGARICVLEQTDRSAPYHSLTANAFPLCLVAGNELTGVSQSIVDQADTAIEIPMFGTKQSLNVAVAYGIALFELVRLWRSR